jgi:hypothetical protein
VTLLVVGSAPCYREDLDAALKLRPGAEIMLVNGACQLVEDAEHVLSGHTDKAEEFASARRAKFPDAFPWRLHATTLIEKRPPPFENFPSVTDWWSNRKMATGATSAGKAAMIGFAMGHEEIILCGCPMDGSGYAPGETDGILQLAACLRVGDPTKQNSGIITRYRSRMAFLAETLFKDRVFSMSGYTRELLGSP